jgi:hemolysin activation/secretion protein
MSALPSGPRVDVRKIDVVGNRVIDTGTLQSLVADGTGKSLTLPEIEALALRITRHYRVKGYFVARAYIPAQDVTEGVVKIRVVEGNYGQFHLKNQSLVRDATVQGMLDDVKGADIVSLDTLERAMLIINDTPGVQVTRADVMPGDKVGTSDFAVDTKAKARYDGFVMLDNYGSIYTGKNRLSFNADVNSPTGSGDRLSVSGMDTDGGGLINGRLGYSLPLAPNGLRGEAAISETKYQLGSTYAPLDATGTAKGVDVTLSYPVRRIRAQTIEVDLNLAHKNLEDKTQSTGTVIPKTTNAVTAGVSLREDDTVAGSAGATQVSLSLSVGHLNISDAIARANDAAGAQLQGNYNKLVADLSRASALPHEFVLTTVLKAQHTLGSKNLDGSERMAVSGSSAVMAYPSGELIGSDAYLAHVDISRPLPPLRALHSNWLLFGDWGSAKAANPLPTDVSRHISDLGLGWNASYGGALIRAAVAHRLDTAPAVSEPFPRNKVLVQAGWTF